MRYFWCRSASIQPRSSPQKLVYRERPATAYTRADSPGERRERIRRAGRALLRRGPVGGALRAALGRLAAAAADPAVRAARARQDLEVSLLLLGACFSFSDMT